MRYMVIVKGDEGYEKGALPDAALVDGPFAEAKEIVGGFWIWNVKSREEAIEWVKRIPFEEGTVELRKVSEPEDFAEVMSPELMEREKKVFEKAQAQQKEQQRKKK